MKRIILHGSLKKFGESFELEVKTAAEAVRAIGVQVPGFMQAIRNGDWHVFRGGVKKGNDIREDEIDLGVGKAGEIHIMPVMSGAGSTFNIIAGVILIALAPFTGGATLAPGIALLGAGVVQMLTPVPSTDKYEEKNVQERPSFLFDGPVNTSTQGLPVPLIYGRVRTGSAVVSAGMTAEQLL